MEFHPFRRKPDTHEVQGQILQIASIAVVEAIDRRAEGTPMPFQVGIPPAPQGISDREYLEMVQNGVSLTLDLRDRDDIACDEYHSSLANGRAITGRSQRNLFTRHYRHPNHRLVFRELRPAEA